MQEEANDFKVLEDNITTISHSPKDKLRSVILEEVTYEKMNGKINERMLFATVEIVS